MLLKGRVQLQLRNKGMTTSQLKQHLPSESELLISRVDSSGIGNWELSTLSPKLNSAFAVHSFIHLELEEELGKNRTTPPPPTTLHTHLSLSLTLSPARCSHRINSKAEEERVSALLYFFRTHRELPFLSALQTSFS